MTDSLEKNTAYDPTKKQKAFDKVSRIPVKVEHSETLKKPEWIRVKAASSSTRFGLFVAKNRFGKPEMFASCSAHTQQYVSPPKRYANAFILHPP